MACIVILGSGGHARDFAAIAQARGQSAVYLDDDPALEHLPLSFHASAGYGSRYVGVNDPSTRRRIVEKYLPTPGDPLVHPSASIDATTEIGWSSVVGASTQIGPDCRIGDHVHIGASCTLTRTTIGAFSTIGPDCDLAGDVTIGAGVFLGVGVVVKNLITIGEGAVIGAGAVVVRDVLPGETVVTRDLTATGAPT